MVVRSKWQSLPTEAINPVSLGIDKLGADDIVDLMINEDRKVLDAVKRERERIAVGVEMIATTLRKEGARAITRLRPTKKDVVVGVSASGMTQFVRGALTRARKTGARIIFVTCDPGTELQTFVDLTISPGVGAEVIAGSTRFFSSGLRRLISIRANSPPVS